MIFKVMNYGELKEKLLGRAVKECKNKNFHELFYDVKEHGNYVKIFLGSDRKKKPHDEIKIEYNKFKDKYSVLLEDINTILESEGMKKGTFKYQS